MNIRCEQVPFGNHSHSLVGALLIVEVTTVDGKVAKISNRGFTASSCLNFSNPSRSRLNGSDPDDKDKME
jgi:hypothetical protein